MASSMELQINAFIMKLKRRQLPGTVETAQKTVELLRVVVSSQPRCTTSSLLEAVRDVGKRLVDASSELVVGNMVRRVMNVIREEDQQDSARGRDDQSDFDEDDDDGDGQEETLRDGGPKDSKLMRARSLASLLEYQTPAAGTAPSSSAAVSRKLKHNIIECMNELIFDLGNICSQIAEQASEHLHANEIILTFGFSTTVLKFLKTAKKRNIAAVVAEAAPYYAGHKMAKQLAAAGIQTTAISDSAIFAMMARINMVVVGASAVLANGGVIAQVGLHTVALAAKQHAVPFVVLTGLHKLSPEQPFDPAVTMNDVKSPGEILDFRTLENKASGQLHVTNPTYDYIPPSLVSLFITDGGGHCPSYVYRLLADHYSPEDYTL